MLDCINVLDSGLPTAEALQCRAVFSNPPILLHGACLHAQFDDATPSKGEEQEYVECFVGFQFFQDKFPQIVEGFTNAAVALERLDELERAKAMYKVAIKKFPESEKPLNSYINMLQMEAVTHFSEKNYQEAYTRYKMIVKLAPRIYDARINLGNIEESLGMFENAVATYKAAVEMEPDVVKGYNSLCRLLLMEVSGAPAGRFDVTQVQRQQAFQDAKEYCSTALKIDPEGHAPNMNLGMVYKESLEFDTAIYYFERAYRAKPNDAVILSNLATTLSRNDRVPEAVELTKKLKTLAAHPDLLEYEAVTVYSLGTILAPFNRSSEEGKAGHLEGMKLAVARAAPATNPKKCKKKVGSPRTLRTTYLEADGVEVDLIDLVDVDSTFGRESAQFVGTASSLKKNKVGAVPLTFVDKQTIAVTIEDVYVEGAGGVMYTDCEIYAVIGLNTDIPRNYKGIADETIRIKEPVVSLLHPSINNYYHWTAESATRFLLSLDYFVGDDEGAGLEPEARFLIPSNIASPFFHDFVDTFGIKLKHEPIIYEPSSSNRYHFDKLHRIDWIQLDTTDLDQSDLWSDYLPSRTALHRLREGAFEHQAGRAERGLGKKYPEVIYISRQGVREVEMETILLDMLEERFGDNFYVHNIASGNRKSKVRLSLQDQIDLFGNAKMIIGPHGAGLVNMVYAPNDVSVIEFPMKPQCNRCFGYIAMALNLDYWIVPEVNCFYHLKYQMSKKKAESVMELLEHIMDRKGIADQLTSRTDVDSLGDSSLFRTLDDDAEHDEL